jgi:subtilisin family serine protease
MFDNKNIVEACFSTGESFYDGSIGGCPNGKTEMYGPGSARHQIPGGDHGSHVTGIATGNDFESNFGVAKGADVLAIQVFTYFPSEGDVLSWNIDQLAGLEYVYTLRNTYNIASANLSLGSVDGYSSFCDSALLAQAISNLRAAGIATAVASGNEGRCGAIANPACISSAVAVNGTDKDDNVYAAGNWHDVMVDLLAPGVSINSARGYNDESYGTGTGTSMAAPHVAGAWAIMRQYDPSMSVAEILAVLQDTGKMLNTDLCPSTTAKPRINVGEALMSLFPIAPPVNIAAEQETNKSFLQTEYINVLTWENNPYNADNNVTHYRIYSVGSGNQLTRLGEVDSSTFSYWHRKVNKREEMTYAVSAVDAAGQESPPFYYTLKFGVTQ